VKLFGGTIDRRTYWIVAALVVGIQFGGGLLAGERLIGPTLVRAIDYGTTIVLAAILAKRFRDFGWPGWLGVAALVVTAALPIALYIYLNGGIITRDQIFDSWIGTSSTLLFGALLIAAGLPRSSGPRPGRETPVQRRIEPRFE
jgi:uncharacterized membrane protein YhaH (DUF805 family)